MKIQPSAIEQPFPRSAAGRSGNGDVDGAFKALLRDLEKDYLRGQPGIGDMHSRLPGDKMAPVPVAASVPRSNEATQVRVSGSALAPAATIAVEVARAEQQAAAPFTDVTAGAPEIRGCGIGALHQSLPQAPVSEPPQAVEEAGNRGRWADVRGTEPTENYSLVRLHVYKAAAGVGISYREAGLAESGAVQRAVELRNRLRANNVQVREVYINARRVEFKEP